ncbi:DUF4157 domain-containing protein [Chitinimonas arctica]|uniref:DUF4157 domain-containing protein n=1 Tax=Chitinimonas arctica TaxID=2594795 RepID=A0A516SLF4_9NEIS|nr:DUF4157 domain-containing protein [Chitinimonas arctica]QDQ29001.1 DUF4157 domain-containing protein [Chitinimonas arctica]
MSDQQSAQTAAKVPPAKPAATGVLQRKCECGNHTTAGGECEACGKKKQRKGTGGSSDDPLELEADRSADRILAGTKPGRISSIHQQLQRQAADAAGPPDLGRLAVGAGRPLEATIRRDMERSFGHDFSQVRVHTDGEADRQTRQERALAFTIGDDIYFRQGAFTPHMPSGRWLLAHELTHVVQQAQGAPTAQAFDASARRDHDALEREADLGADRAVRGKAAGVKLRAPQMLMAFPMCRSILDAREEQVIAESTVQRDLATRLATAGPVERELPIPDSSFRPYIDSYYRRPRQARSVIYGGVGRAGRAGVGSADLAMLNGTELEVIEVKRGSWTLITDAELQLENYVQKGNENLLFLEERWGMRRRGPPPVITSVRPMPTSRLNIPSPIRLGPGNTPTSVSWCRDGLIAFKAIGGQDTNIYVCGSTLRSPESFIDPLVSGAELLVDRFIDGHLVPAIDQAIQSTSIRQALERLLAEPAIGGQLQGLLGPAAGLVDLLGSAGPLIDQLDGLLQGQADRAVRIAIETMKDRVIAEVRRTVKRQLRQILQNILTALCVGAAQVTAQEVMRELERRMNGLVGEAIPVAVAAMVGAVVAQAAAAAGEALLEVLKYLAIAVGVVIAAIALWEVAAVIAAGATLAEIGTAIAAFFTSLARTLGPLLFA